MGIKGGTDGQTLFSNVIIPIIPHVVVVVVLRRSSPKP